MEKQKPDTWRLVQFHQPGTNGACTEIGDFPSYRSATEAARALAPISKLKGGFTVTYLRSNKREGSMVDGYTVPVTLDPPKYNPHVEVTLKDGRTFWLEDIEGVMLNSASMGV